MKTVFLFMICSMFICMTSFSQTPKKNIEKLAQDPKTAANAAKADVYILGNKKVIQPRSLGTILAFEFHSAEKEYLNKVKEETMQLALKHGVLIRPLGNTIYIMPPYCITAIQLQKVHSTLELIIDKI